MKRSSFIVNPPRRRAALELRAPYTYTSYAHLSRARSLPAAPSPSGVGGLAAHALVMTCGFAAPMTSARTATASFGDDEEKRKQACSGYFSASATFHELITPPMGLLLFLAGTVWTPFFACGENKNPAELMM